MGLFNKKRKHRHFGYSNDEDEVTLHKNLAFTAAEQYKMIRANIGFRLKDHEKCPVIAITSSMRGEGKSTTAINLSYVFAEKECKVLLIDGDLRIPSIARKLKIESSPGLSEILKDEEAPIPEFKSLLLSNWFILPSGDIPTNPSELLSSRRMENFLKQLREIFDYIIIDLPPVNIVSDAVAISKLISGMIVVVREDYTRKKELDRCIRQLEFSNVNILGCVMNESKFERGAFGRNKKRKYYEYYRYYLSDPNGNSN